MKRIISSILLAVFIFTSSFTTSFAIEDQFEVSLTVTAADVTAPSIPTGLSATAVSTSQINLSWTASTDNVAVTGYRIFRDSIFITTSAGTTYSDTGLSPSTTYTYTVSAVDAASNESAQSAGATATTFSPEAPGGGGGGGGGSVRPVIYDVVVTPSGTSAFMSWTTNKFTTGTVVWGTTPDYGAGISSEALYLTEHQTLLQNLQPGTVYFFKITALDSSGRTVEYQGSFDTTPIAETVPNPTNFTATPGEREIFLSWNNPQIPDFEEVRIMRSESFFPGDPFDGQVIYEGRGISFTDSDVEIGKRYYYAIFTKTSDGKYSSGALDDAIILRPGEPIPGEVIDEIPQAPVVHPAIEALSLLDFDFIQEGQEKQHFDVNGGTVVIDGSKNLTISLDYGKVPEILKTILITLTDPDDATKKFSFLLRVNEEKTRYIATIGPLGKSGKYGVRISIVDYKNQGLKKIEGSLIASVARSFLPSQGNFFSVFISFIIERFWNLLLLIVLIAIILEALRRIFKRQKENKDKYVFVENKAYHG
jgi:chitodextrinase